VSSILPEHKEEFRVMVGPVHNFLLEWITKTVLGIWGKKRFINKIDFLNFDKFLELKRVTVELNGRHQVELPLMLLQSLAQL